MMLVLVPTLNRPELLKRFLQSFKDTGADCAGYVLIDDADMKKNSAAYAECKHLLHHDWIMRNTKDAVTMGDKVRFVWPEIQSGITSVGILNDDHVCITPNWDKKVEALIDGTNMVSTNDGNWNFGCRVVGLTAWSKKLLDVCGFPIFPRKLQHLYIDDIWKAIGESTGCWLETNKVDIHHKHVLRKDMEPDDTYKKVYDQSAWKLDTPEFQQFMEQDFKDVCARIKDLRTVKSQEEKFA